MHDNKEYDINIRNLKQALNHGLLLKELHRVIKFNQETWLKPYIDINTEIRKNAKTYYEKDFFKMMNNVVSIKELFGIRTKLFYNKLFFRKFISKRNENSIDTHN